MQQCMLQRDWPRERADDRDAALPGATDPGGKLDSVRNGCTQHSDADVGREHQDARLPNDLDRKKGPRESVNASLPSHVHRSAQCDSVTHPALDVIHVLNFVKNNPVDRPQHVIAAVEHAAQDLRRHDQALALLPDADVAGDNADRVKLLRKVANCQDERDSPPSVSDGQGTARARRAAGDVHF